MYDTIFNKSMNKLFLRLQHCYQRNFGRVYVSRGLSDEDGWYSFRCRFGKIALVWTNCFGDIPFVCGLRKDGAVIILGKEYPGYLQTYGSWKWKYDLTENGKYLGKGGYWR